MNGQEIDNEEQARDESADEAQQAESAGGEAKPEMDLPSALAALEEANRKLREVNRESANRRKASARCTVVTPSASNNCP